MKRIVYLFVLVFFMISACNKTPKFETTETGIEFMFITQNKDGIKPVVGDAVKLTLKYYADATDSLLFSSKEVSDEFKIQFAESAYKGSIDEVIGMMTKGDTGIFKIDAENFFNNSVGMELPTFLKKGDKLRFEIKIEDIVDKATVDAELEAKNKEMAETEDLLLQDYLTTNKIVATPTASGLIYVVNEKANGKQAKKGDKVSVHYTGSLLNGQVFDSSVERGTPFEFELGAGQVIAGWDEGIALMKVGEKATLIIPSKIGYGATGAGQSIPPYATLVFAVTLLEIK